MVYTTIVRLVEPDPVWLQQSELTEMKILNVSIAGELHRTRVILSMSLVTCHSHASFEPRLQIAVTGGLLKHQTRAARKIRMIDQ